MNKTDTLTISDAELAEVTGNRYTLLGMMQELPEQERVAMEKLIANTRSRMEGSGAKKEVQLAALAIVMAEVQIAIAREERS